MAAKSKGLGRGIDALFSDFSSLEEVDTTTEKVVEVKLSELRPNPYQPRKTFDETAMNELADSIRQSGVFQPIIIRQSEIKGYEIIAGERRFRASKLADLDTIPAIVRTFTENEMMQIAVLENLQREDLSPLEEAEAYEMLMTNISLTQEELSKRLGKSRSHVANHLRLLTLPNPVKELVQDNQLSMGQARTLLGLKDKAKIVELARKVVDEGMTVRQLEQLVITLNGEAPKETKKKSDSKKVPKSPYIRESEDRLMDKFGTSVIIQEKSGKGKIEIEYLSTEDLSRILDILDISFDV